MKANEHVNQSVRDREQCDKIFFIIKIIVMNEKCAKIMFWIYVSRRRNIKMTVIIFLTFSQKFLKIRLAYELSVYDI